MRCHVHGKLEHAGVPVDFSISLDAITVQAAELYVRDLFQGPYAVPVIDEVELTDVDVDEDPNKAVDAELRRLFSFRHIRPGRQAS